MSLKINNSSIYSDNRREYFRVRFMNPLCAELEVMQIQNNPEETVQKSGVHLICINDVGPGGLMFSSDQKLEINPDIILEINMQILNESIKVFATVVRCKFIDEDYYQYGAKFVMMDDNLRSRIFRMFGTLSIRTRNKISLPSCCFCEVGREGCWKYTPGEPIEELKGDYPENSFSKNRNV